MATRRALTRETWLRKAMEVLRTDGIGGVRVLNLARSLGVTRGSFYWHFRDRQDLLDHMVDWWGREMTDTVIAHTDGVRGKGVKRILALAEFVTRRELARYDSAMRSWAAGDRKVAVAARRITRKRIEYVASLFREAGFIEREATSRGHLLAIYIMSEGVVFAGESLQTRLSLLRRQVRTLTRVE